MSYMKSFTIDANSSESNSRDSESIKVMEPHESQSEAEVPTPDLQVPKNAEENDQITPAIKILGEEENDQITAAIERLGEEEDDQVIQTLGEQVTLTFHALEHYCGDLKPAHKSPCPETDRLPVQKDLKNYRDHLKRTKDMVEEVMEMYQEAELEGCGQKDQNSSLLGGAMASQINQLKVENEKCAELNKLKKEYADENQKLENMRVRLAEKEKKIYQLEKEINSLRKKEQRYDLILDEDEAKEQTKICQQILQLLSKITTLSLEQQMISMRGIRHEASKLKACNRNRRSVSWKT